MFGHIEEMTLECPECGEQIHKEFKCNKWDKSIEIATGYSKWEDIICEDCGYTFQARARFDIEIDVE